MAGVELLKDTYWSKSEAFLLPLTGLSRSQKYPIKSYLFWEDYSIENFNMVLVSQYEDYQDFLKYCKRVILPVLGKNGYLIETHDREGETIYVLDMSEWALDIEMFLKGKYSKMSREAKNIITDYHTFYEKGPKILIEISASLDPNARYKVLDDLTALEYAAKHYELDLKELKKVGEIGGIYNKKNETLDWKEEVVDGNVG